MNRDRPMGPRPGPVDRSPGLGGRPSGERCAAPRSKQSIFPVEVHADSHRRTTRHLEPAVATPQLLASHPKVPWRRKIPIRSGTTSTPPPGRTGVRLDDERRPVIRLENTRTATNSPNDSIPKPPKIAGRNDFVPRHPPRPACKIGMMESSRFIPKVLKSRDRGLVITITRPGFKRILESTKHFFLIRPMAPALGPQTQFRAQFPRLANVTESSRSPLKKRNIAFDVIT